jgi:hypothetical protein
MSFVLLGTNGGDELAVVTNESTFAGWITERNCRDAAVAGNNPV